MAISLDILENLGGREQEALFARDEDGTLIRKVAATREMFAKRVNVVIDGIPIEMPAAVPVTDALGNIKNGPDGLPIPRSTTIYDAAVQLVRNGTWRMEDLNERIPVLCHQQHLTPVAVCRVCSVHVSKRRKRDGKLAPSEKLVPACQHEVQPDMVVTTREGGYPGWEALYREYLKKQKVADDAIEDNVKQMQNSLFKHSKPVRQAVNVLTEFLMTDHFHPDARRDDRFRNELEDIARTTGHLPKRMPSMADFNIDDIEPVAGAPESLSRQLIDLSVYDLPAPGTAPSPKERFKSRLTLPMAPSGEQGKNFAAARLPKSRPLNLPVVPPPAAEEDLREDPQWVQRDQADYARFPYSARTILVDHDRCIVCDRCVRACSEVKPFKIIGHTGKGYNTRISFDLDKLMNDSNCVQCGECMVSCPTGALSLKRRVAPRAFPDAPQIPKDPSEPLPQPKPGDPSKLLSAVEMSRVEIKYKDESNKIRKFRPFRSIPLAYLRWNEGSVRRREVQPGEILCYQGEYGRTAFFLESGSYEVYFKPASSSSGGVGGFLSRIFGGGSRSRFNPRELGILVDTIEATATVVGELACLTARPRAASIRAKTRGVVYEVSRNLLDMSQRSPASRDVLGLIYLRNAIKSCLRSPKNRLFSGLSDELRGKIADYLADKDRSGSGSPKDRAVLRRLEPGEGIVSQGDPANDFYIIRLGTVKISRTVRGREWVIGQQTSDDIFGQIALLADDMRIRTRLNEEEKAGLRTASVTALDPVEVVKISRDAFRGMCDQFPELKEKLIEDSVRLLEGRKSSVRPVQDDRLGDFLNQGLYQGQRMLVLDLESCTRCDECTRACASAHRDGVSRLLREGLRYGQFLVAASCRSCQKPYCMDGCPVDAIHRAERSLEVLIDDHCIGCSLCEKNCPFGSIQMVVKKESGLGLQRTAATVQKAVNCDLCHDLINETDDPFCVAACPHEAAFRWDAATLDAAVVARSR